MPYWLPYCTFLDDSDALPPLPSNASVYALTLQWAYRVVFAAPMVVDGETFVPPLLAVYQPWNVWPVRVAVGRLPYWLPYCTVLDDSDALPPLPSNASVYEFTDQCAYRVTSPVTVWLKSYLAPPSLDVYQPWNVWPARVGSVGRDALDPYFTDCEATAEPPFESKLTE